MIVVHKGTEAWGPMMSTHFPNELAVWLAWKATRMEAYLSKEEKDKGKILTQGDALIALLLKIKEDLPDGWGDKSIKQAIEKGWAKYASLGGKR